jgi:hypothetical protein
MSRRILTVITLLVLGIAIPASSASAQAIVDISPDQTYTDYQGYSIPLGSGRGSRIDIDKTPNEITISTNSDNVEVMFDGAYPAALHLGTHIGPQGNWRKPEHDVLNRNGAEGYWIGVEDRYLPVRYQTAAGWHYAWIRLDIDAEATFFTLKEYAISAKANEAIAAGREVTAGVEENVPAKSWTLEGRELSTSVDWEVQVVSLSGVVLVSESLDAGETLMLDVEAGLYLVSIGTKQSSEVLKVAIQ